MSHNTKLERGRTHSEQVREMKLITSQVWTFTIKAEWQQDLEFTLKEAHTQVV